MLALVLLAASNPLSACGQGVPASAKGRLAQSGDLDAAYRAHAYRLGIIADRLKKLWLHERVIIDERDNCGRNGDMVTVTALNQNLLAVRQEIDYLRAEMTRENRVLALIRSNDEN